MKKSLLALAVLGTFAGTAAAQSTVTLFGVVDVGVRSVKNGDTTVRQVSSNGINTSRIGLRGVEDLGGGLKAGFWLEAGLNPDTGTQSDAARFWNRRATVSLLGSFGEVRLGRDYSVTFNELAAYDPFGTNGVADYSHMFSFFGAPTGTRTDNAISYFLPSGIGGVYGQFQYAPGESAPLGATGNINGRYVAGRVGYGAGPIDVSVAYSQNRLITPTADNAKVKNGQIGASYDFGVAKVLAHYSRTSTEGLALFGDGDARQDTYLVGAVVPIGPGELHASYDRTKGKSSAEDTGAKQYAIGYVYNLSKRTAVYGAFSRINNDDKGVFVTGTPPAVADITPAAGFNSTGYEVGLRHSF